MLHHAERALALPAALLLFLAIVATPLIAALMCAYGWPVTPIPWRLIGLVWLYNIVWMFVLGGVHVATERFADYRTTRHKSVVLINQALHRTAAAAVEVA